MESKKIKTEFINFVTMCHTMTVATSKNNVPWSAPVYYLYFDTNFYFLSNPNSRHIKEADILKIVAVSIYSIYSAWHEIKGVQMDGRISIVEKYSDSALIIKKYIEKFPSIKELPMGKIDFSLKNIAQNLIKNLTTNFNVKLYQFNPKTIFYLDNSVKFGFRERVFL